MTLKQKVIRAIDNIQHNTTPYTDDYDGFTHYTYVGLIESVLNELTGEGYGDNTPMKVVEDFVFDLI